MCVPLQPTSCPDVRRDGLRKRSADLLASVLVFSVLHLNGPTSLFLTFVEPIVIDNENPRDVPQRIVPRWHGQAFVIFGMSPDDECMTVCLVCR